MSATKRYLEDQTDSVLDSVRLTGSAVICERGLGQGYWLLSKTLETLERQWLCGPSREARQRLDSARAALSESAEQTLTVPPLEEADALSNWREALEDAVEEALESLEQWLAPYGLELQWETVGLCAVPVDTEWATAHSEGVWRGARQ